MMVAVAVGLIVAALAWLVRRPLTRDRLLRIVVVAVILIGGVLAGAVVPSVGNELPRPVQAPPRLLVHH